MSEKSQTKIVFDALVEEHLAVQQLLQEAEGENGEPSTEAHERLANAFIAAARALQRYTVPHE